MGERGQRKGKKSPASAGLQSVIATATIISLSRRKDRSLTAMEAEDVVRRHMGRWLAGSLS